MRLEETELVDADRGFFRAPLRVAIIMAAAALGKSILWGVQGSFKGCYKSYYKGFEFRVSVFLRI